MTLVVAAVMHGPVHYLLCALLVVTAMASRSPRVRQLALLLASWLFYAGWGIGFLCVLIASSLMNYALGAALKRNVTVGRLWMGVALNIALLAFFKYGTVALVPDPRLGFFEQLLRPIGMSFWTLEALSYLFDTYREEDLDPSLLEFCLYMAFWPTVLTGPICRLPSLLPQFRQPIRPTADDVSVGLTRILQGLFMKMVLAEVLGAGWSPGAGVNAGFDRLGGWSGTDVWFLAVGFGFQLFFDFAGYSHIVIGAARLFGIRLEENFDRPFLSATPAVFWTRWHMSLSLWIRDYVFLQLAQLVRGRWWVYSSLFLSMVVCGLWHEASATFIVWGAYHGFLVVSHRIGQQVKRSLPFRWSPKFGVPLSSVSTFCLVSVGWLFFRAPTVTQSLQMFRALFAFGSYGRLSLPGTFYLATILTILAWAALIAAETVVARLRAANEEGLRISSEPPPGTSVAGSGTRLSVLVVEFLDFSAARRWWWLAPAMIVVGLFLGLAINDLRPAPPKTPFMYSVF